MNTNKIKKIGTSYLYYKNNLLNSQYNLQVCKLPTYSDGSEVFSFKKCS